MANNRRPCSESSRCVSEKAVNTLPSEPPIQNPPESRVSSNHEEGDNCENHLDSTSDNLGSPIHESDSKNRSRDPDSEKVTRRSLPFDNRLSYETARSAILERLGPSYRNNPPERVPVPGTQGSSSTSIGDQHRVSHNGREGIPSPVRAQQRLHDSSYSSTFRTGTQEAYERVQVVSLTPMRPVINLEACDRVHTNSSPLSAVVRETDFSYMSNREAKCLDGIVINPDGTSPEINPSNIPSHSRGDTDLSTEPVSPPQSHPYLSSQFTTRDAVSNLRSEALIPERWLSPISRLGDARRAYQVVHPGGVPAGGFAGGHSIRAPTSATATSSESTQRRMSQEAELVHTYRSPTPQYNDENNMATIPRTSQHQAVPTQSHLHESTGLLDSERRPEGGAEESPSQDEQGVTRNTNRSNRKFRVFDSALESGDGDGFISLLNFLAHVPNERMRSSQVLNGQSYLYGDRESIRVSVDPMNDREQLEELEYLHQRSELMYNLLQHTEAHSYSTEPNEGLYSVLSTSLQVTVPYMAEDELKSLALRGGAFSVNSSNRAIMEYGPGSATVPILSRKLTDFFFCFNPETLGFEQDSTQEEGQEVDTKTTGIRVDGNAHEKRAKPEESEFADSCQGISTIENLGAATRKTQNPSSTSPHLSAGSEVQRPSTPTNRQSTPYIQFTIEAQSFLRPNGQQGYKITSIYESAEDKSPTKIPAPLCIRKTSNSHTPQPRRHTSSPPSLMPQNMPEYLTITMREAHTPKEHDIEKETLASYEHMLLQTRPDSSLNSMGRYANRGREAAYSGECRPQQAPARTSAHSGVDPDSNHPLTRGGLDECDGGRNAVNEIQSNDPLSAAYSWTVTRPVFSITEDRVEAQMRAAAAMEHADNQALIVAAEAEAERAAAAVAKNGRKGRSNSNKGPSSKQEVAFGLKAMDPSSSRIVEKDPTSSKSNAATTSHGTMICPKAPDMDQRCPIMGTHPIRGIARDERPAKLDSPPTAGRQGNIMGEGIMDSLGDSDSDHGETESRGDTGFGHYAVRSRKSYNLPYSPPSKAHQAIRSGAMNVNVPNHGHAFPFNRSNNNGGASSSDAAQAPPDAAFKECFHPAPLYPEGTELNSDQRARQYEYLERERIRHDNFVKNPTIFRDIKKVEDQRKAIMARQKGMAKCSVCGRWREPGTKCCDIRVSYE